MAKVDLGQVTPSKGTTTVVDTYVTVKSGTYQYQTSVNPPSGTLTPIVVGALLRSGGGGNSAPAGVQTALVYQNDEGKVYVNFVVDNPDGYIAKYGKNIYINVLFRWS